MSNSGSSSHQAPADDRCLRQLKAALPPDWVLRAAGLSGARSLMLSQAHRPGLLEAFGLGHCKGQAELGNTKYLQLLWPALGKRTDSVHRTGGLVQHDLYSPLKIVWKTLDGFKPTWIEMKDRPELGQSGPVCLCLHAFPGPVALGHFVFQTNCCPKVQRQHLPSPSVLWGPKTIWFNPTHHTVEN